MLNPLKVFERVKHFISFDESKKDEIYSICAVNTERVLSVLKDKNLADNPKLLQAAASMSFYDYAVKFASEGNDGITSFKAGDITISKSEQSLIEIAEKMRNEALADIVPFMSDDEFFITLS